MGALLVGVVALLAAGVSLAQADLGTSLRARACDTSSLTGLGLLLVGGLCIALGSQLVRLHGEGAILLFAGETLLVTVPIPASLLGLALPGTMGCAAARGIGNLPIIGEALIGTSGVTLAAAAASLTGAAFASAAHVSWTAPRVAVARAVPDLVDLAIEEAEALKHDPTATRFHGVD